MKDISVIMVSSITSTPHAAFFPMDDMLSIDGWISKPVAPESLLKKVEQTLGQ